MTLRLKGAGRRTLLLATATGLARPALAQPSRRPLRLVVPFATGGSVDALARLLAERLPALLDQPVVVENRGGAGGVLGADAVAKGPPDGTVAGLLGVATLCAAPFLYRSLPFDAGRDLKPVTLISDTALMLAVSGARSREEGWTDAAAMLAWAKRHPGALRIGFAGTGSVTHLVTASVARAAGVEVTQVPYRGGAPAIADTLGGSLDGLVDAPATLRPHLPDGRLRALGVTSARRIALLPDVPALAETPGLEGFDVRSWNAVMVPAATPAAEVDRLFAAFRTVAADPSLRAALLPLGYEALTSESPAALANQIAAETPRWRRMVEISGAQPE